jgi:O-succinylbenzoic acid--CoA ligase
MAGANQAELLAIRLPAEQAADAVLDAWARRQPVAVLDPNAPDAATAHARAALRLDEPVDPSIAAVVVTSGTTARPKAVELTWAGLECMARGFSAAIGADPATDRWLVCLPVHHVAGLAILARAWVSGVPVTAHNGFEIDRVADAPEKTGATLVSLVPTMLKRLLDAEPDTLARFRCVVLGGARTPAALRRRAVDAGAAFFDAYGLSETWGGCVINGRPITDVDARLDDSGGIIVHGPVVMRGYRGDPDATAAAFTADGWLRTGDAGVLDDDGRIAIVDRARDLIITGGVNVSPTAVEEVLIQHPAILDVCVVGVPDDEWGERVVAHVVAQPATAAPTLDELRAFAGESLSAAQLPREVRTRTEIPRSSSGKALRRLVT